MGNSCWERSHIPYSHLREVGKFNLRQRLGFYTLCTQGNHFMQFGITIGHVLFILYTGCEIEYSAIFWQGKPAFSPKLGTASIQQLAAFLTLYYRAASVHYILNPICTVSLYATHTAFFYITSCNLSYQVKGWWSGPQVMERRLLTACLLSRGGGHLCSQLCIYSE